MMTKTQILISDRQHERAKELIRLMMNISEYDFLKADRTRLAVACRMIITHQLRQEGWKYLEIAVILNKNHSTIIHYNRMFENINMPGFEGEKDLWKKFKNKLYELDTEQIC